MSMRAGNKVDTLSSSSENEALYPCAVGKKKLSERYLRLGRRTYMLLRRLEKRAGGTTRRGIFVRLRTRTNTERTHGFIGKLIT